MSDASVNANANSDVGAKSMPHAKGQSMFARIAWAVVLGFVLLHIVGYFLYGHERMLEGARTFAMSTAERAYELDQVVTHQPELLPHFNTQWFTLAQIATPKLLSEQRWPHNEEVQAAVLARLQTLGLENDAAVQMAYSGGPRGKFEIQFPAQSGGYVYAQASTLLANRSYASPAGLSTSLLFLVVVGAVLWVTRRVTKQLDRFSAAAVALGEGYESQTLPENVGPKELRRASVAFNGMQRRVMSLLRERSDMLAGVSHDLRTLVTAVG